MGHEALTLLSCKALKVQGKDTGLPGARQHFYGTFVSFGVNVTSASFCSCGLEQDYENCCGVFHSGKSLPQSAVLLMRSRYSAFALKNAQYLIETLHPSQRSGNESLRFKESFHDIEWVGLEILDLVKGGVGEKEGVVEFVASYKAPGPGQLRERSKFVYEDGRWFYVTGLVEPAKKLGRNEACWCMSTKKFKKCHGRPSN